jgi:hypothetical protein
MAKHLSFTKSGAFLGIIQHFRAWLSVCQFVKKWALSTYPGLTVNFGK